MGNSTTREAQHNLHNLGSIADILLNRFIEDNICANPEWFSRILASRISHEFNEWITESLPKSRQHLLSWTRLLKNEVEEHLSPNLTRAHAMTVLIKDLEEFGQFSWFQALAGLILYVREILIDFGIGFELDLRGLNVVSFRNWSAWALLDLMAHYILLERCFISKRLFSILTQKYRTKFILLARDLAVNLDKQMKFDIQMRLTGVPLLSMEQHYPVHWKSPNYALTESALNQGKWGLGTIGAIDCGQRGPGHCTRSLQCVKCAFIHHFLQRLFGHTARLLDKLVQSHY